MKTPSQDAIKFPKIVTPAQWQQAHESFLVKEKTATRERDASRRSAGGCR